MPRSRKASGPVAVTDPPPSARTASDPRGTAPVFASPAEDFRKLGRHAAASGEEIRGFLRELQGKSPRELLGSLAGSGLTRSAAQAAVGAGLLIVLLTAIPFAWNRMSGGGDSAPAADGAGAEPARQAIPSDPELDSPASLDPAATAERLGVGESIEASPARNPLEDAGDDLLKDLD